MIASVGRWWGPLVLYMAFIYAMSAREVPGAFSDAPDKLVHAGAYFVMGLLAVRALARGLLRPAGRRVLLGGVGIATLYGASDEWHQSFVAGRDASLADLGADALGAALAGLALAFLWNRNRTLAVGQGAGREGSHY